MTTTDKKYFDARFDEMRVALEAKFDSRINELRAELHKTIAETVKWCAGIVASGLVLYTTVFAFLLNNSTPRAAIAQPQYIAVPVPIQAAPVKPGAP